MSSVKVGEGELKGLYRDMVLIRRFEERTAEMYAMGKITGFTHLYIGEEAVAVGAISALRHDDYVVSTYREHGHCLAKGTEPKSVMAELFGRSTGVSKGKGGSMHLYDASRRFLGGYAIVAGGLPLAVGVAQAIKYRKESHVVACFFGDGATNAGAFHESLNLASAWKLPIVFICENNLYGIGTAIGRVSAVRDLYKKAKAYDMPGEKVNGMDVLAVREVTVKAVERAREGEGPSFMEAMTYRFRGHSMSDPGEYRTKREEKIWRERDPIVKLAQRMRDEAVASPDELQEIKEEVERVVEEAIAFAEGSPWPEKEELMKDVYVDGEQ
jgi:pyruvate dehydrogenase E1 component alpha subunit